MQKMHGKGNDNSCHFWICCWHCLLETVQIDLGELSFFWRHLNSRILRQQLKTWRGSSKSWADSSTSAAVQAPHRRQAETTCSLVQQEENATDYESFGNFVRHTRLQYPGVIFGWDPQFMLNEDYIVSMRVNQLQHGRNQPFYCVLVDQNYRNTSTYVAQENLTFAPENGPIFHDEIGLRFMGYKDGEYVPNTYLSYL